MKQLSLGKKIIFSIIAIILFFLLLEGSIRSCLFFTNFGSKEPNLDPYEELNEDFFWWLKANYKNTIFSPDTGKEELLMINSKHFRGKEFDIQKRKGITRIIIMGDSVTFGIAPEDCPYAAQLQKLFDEKYPNRFEVINAGVEGYSSEHVLKRLKYDILQYKPDIITIYVGWNDLYSIDPLNPLNYRKMSGLANFLNNFYIYKGGRKFIFLVLKPKIEKFLPRDINSDDVETYQSFEPEIYKNNLREIIKTCQDNNIKVILLNLASILSDEMSPEAIKKVHYPYFSSDIEKLKILQQNYNNVIKRISQEKNVSLVDINEAINQMPDKENLFFDTMHPYCSGNTVIAQTIFNFFVNQNIINTK